MLTSLKSFTKNNIVYGQYYEDDGVFIFFGNKRFEHEHFSFFPEIKFHFLKQVHGNNIIEFKEISETLIHADGHYTNQKKVGLVIQTADCLPLMVFDFNHKWAMALHAGWKGVENQIIPWGLKSLATNAQSDLFSVFIGPHIQQESFEIDHDVSEKLSTSTITRNSLSTYHLDKNKYYANLKQIASLQIQEASIRTDKLFLSNIDTFSCTDYSSYRRIKGPARNWSFIYLK